MLTREQRKELVRKSVSSLGSDALSAWFNFVPVASVCRDNFVEWLYWAIFSSTVEDGEEFLPEVEEYLAEMEQRDGIQLMPGRTPDIKPIRVTLDPVRTTHRPLIWYLVCVCFTTNSAILTIHPIACWLYRRMVLLGPLLVRIQTLYLGGPLSCVPSTTVYYVFQIFACASALLVPPTPLDHEVPRCIPTRHRGTSDIFPVERSTNSSVRRLGCCPTFLSFGNSLKKTLAWASSS